MGITKEGIEKSKGVIFMALLKLSPAWDIYYQKIRALFKHDDQINVVYDRENLEVKLYIDNSSKAYALDKLLVNEASFGNQKLKINVVPANGKTEAVEDDALYDWAFAGNELYSYSRVVSGIYSNKMTFVVFAPVVVQYYTDNLGDINGYCSTLAQDVAYEVFKERDGVFYCTDVLVEKLIPEVRTTTRARRRYSPF